jgi:tRNA(Ile)-lysidine synthase
MAGSKTPRPTPADFPSLDALAHHLPLAVALSGGADSTALLIACALRWPGQVQAIHVHHGLQDAADRFQAHCEELCLAWQVPLTTVRVDARHGSGESPEDAARRARYAALVQAARELGLSHVALAQHADDQLETLLLALSRGAGLPGLSAMPARREQGGVVFHRPWLDVPGQTLREVLRRHDLPWEDDPSNTDVRFTRNRIRHELLPALARTFANPRQTFARSAAHAAQAQLLLDEVAQEDLVRVGNPPRIAELQTLSEARLSNVLRHWLSQQAQAPSTAQLQALITQVRACTTRGHAIDLKVGAGFVRRDGAVLRCYNL